MKQIYILKKNLSLLKRGFNLALFVFAIATGVQAQVTTFPWVETFEDDSTTRPDWTQIYEVNNMSWTYAESPSTGGAGVMAYEGTKFANYPADSHNFDKTKLVSPVLDLTNQTDVSVSFYFRNPFWSPDQNWLRVFYRISPTSAWVEVQEFHTDVSTWTSSGAILLPNPTATYQIAIECETDYGFSTTVDALTVTTTTLGVDEFSKAQVKFFPNPIKDVLNFSSQEMVSTVQVFNLLGQKLLEKDLNVMEGQVDISSLPTGNYIFQVTTEKGTKIIKIIKE